MLKRRKFEDLLIFNRAEGTPVTSNPEGNIDHSTGSPFEHPTLLDLMAHLAPLLTQLKLLATICFT